jgi:hypothetical protein
MNEISPKVSAWDDTAYTHTFIDTLNDLKILLKCPRMTKIPAKVWVRLIIRI